MNDFLAHATAIVESSTDILKADNDRYPAIKYTRQPDGSFAYIPSGGVARQSFPDVSETVFRDAYDVVHRLEGPEASVKARVEQLFSDYPPIGYGTRVTVFPDRTVVVHAGSCE